MLDTEDTNGIFFANNRHASEGMEHILPGFWPVGKVWMAGRFIEVERLNLLGNRADETFAKREFGDVDRLLFQPARRVKLKHTFAAEIDGADFAPQNFPDGVDDLVQLGLRCRPRRHHLVQAAQDFARGCGGGTGHGKPLPDCRKSFQPAFAQADR